MALSVVYSRALLGLKAPLVSIETDVAPGLPTLSIVGLPETAVKESRDRVRSALYHAGFTFPEGRITINLAPADLPKEGCRYDLPIALGILAASHQIPQDLSAYEFIGELALSGDLRFISGVLPTALASQAAGRTLILPLSCAQDAAVLKDISLLGASDLSAVCAHLRGEKRLSPVHAHCPPPPAAASALDLQDVVGQLTAKRGLILAAAGGHHVLMVGPPGTGKTLLANRLLGLLPELSYEQALEVAAIYSLQQGFDLKQWRQRPFRAPHHTASPVALVGGGRQPSPGEISLAHQGVLFLDELPEYSKQTLEILRQPLESGTIHIARAGGRLQFPAQFQLVAAMNPCPCGYRHDPKHHCHCTALQIQRYQNKISGPLLDRIDIQLWMERPTQGISFEQKPPAEKTGQSSAEWRSIIARTHTTQIDRQGKLNAHLQPAELLQHCVLSDKGLNILKQASTRYGLSMRSQHRLLKVARTIADLQESLSIMDGHLLEALSYRLLDNVACTV